MKAEKVKEVLKEVSPMITNIEQKDSLQIQIMAMIADAIMTGAEIGRRSVTSIGEHPTPKARQ